MKTVVLFLFSLSALFAATPERSKEYFDPDVQRLISVREFAFGPVGYAGAMSEGEKAFAGILKKKESIRYMIAAFDAGTPEARCYALVALREMSDTLYDHYELAFRKNPPPRIITMDGGTVTEQHPSKILAAIDGGTYRRHFKAHEEDR